jgi:hypothetical protein
VFVDRSCRKGPAIWQKLEANGRIPAVRYVKAVSAGLLVAVATAVLYLAAKLAWTTAYMGLVLVPRAQGSATFGSWDAEYPQSFDLRAPLLLGFIIGFWWMLRRQRRTAEPQKIRGRRHGDQSRTSE